MARDKENIEHTINFKLTDSSRKNLKDRTIIEFLKEDYGHYKNGIKYVTHYKYFVETLSDGRRIYLLRPTHLNKGIDFQVWVERLDGEKDKRPSHNDIKNDLRIKKAENQEEYNMLIEAIMKVHNCEEPDEVLRGYCFNFIEGHPPELLLKVVKWLFIEQDITYWNYTGRGMLREAILEV